MEKQWELPQTSNEGWPDWAIFCQSGYFWMPIVTFWKDEVTQRNGDILGDFLLKIFFPKGFDVGIFRFQKRFVVNVLHSQIELWCRYFGNFWAGWLFWLLFQKFGQFFPIILSPWSNEYKWSFYKEETHF